VPLASESSTARHRLHIELWSWSAWLVLGIVSYPAVVLIWMAPRAGVVAGIVAGIFIAYTASLGYAQRRELNQWVLPSMLSIFGGMVASLVSFGADGTSANMAALIGFVTAAETAFIWHFLPWLVRDANDPEASTSTTFHRLSRPLRPVPPIRAALPLAIFLALLVFGLGAMWARGESRVPSPAVWLIAVCLLATIFMFLERLVLLERSAREGNLLMAIGSYRKLLGAAFITLVVLSALAALVPLRHARKAAETARLGTRAADTPFSPLQDSLENATARAASGLRNLAAGFRGMPKAAFPVLLLLLLLLLALVLVWGFRKSRAAEWILRQTSFLIGLAARAWRRLWSLVLRLLGRGETGAGAPAPTPQPADELVDPFEDPASLAGLTARDIIVQTYHFMLNFAEMLGHGRRRGQTPFEYAQLLGRAAPEARESVLVLTWAYSGAMYGGEIAKLPDPSSIRDSWERISSAMTAGMTPDELSLKRRSWLAARRLDSDGRK